jgi:uracil-DNA glycosylase
MTAKISGFVRKLATTATGDMLFNPYNEFSKMSDDKTAPGLRQQNLKLYLNSHMKLKTNKMWIYLAPTYLEAKRSGVPLANASIYRKVESILNAEKLFEKATKTKNRPNNTTLSTSLWNAANELNIHPIIWPVIPFYAHKENRLKSKRSPTQKEIVKYRVFIDKVIAVFKPTTILAVGKGTKEALDMLKIKSHYVKHPRSSKKEFKRNVSKYT